MNNLEMNIFGRNPEEQARIAEAGRAAEEVNRLFPRNEMLGPQNQRQVQQLINAYEHDNNLDGLRQLSQRLHQEIAPRGFHIPAEFLLRGNENFEDLSRIARRYEQIVFQEDAQPYAPAAPAAPYARVRREGILARLLNRVRNVFRRNRQPAIPQAVMDILLPNVINGLLNRR